MYCPSDGSKFLQQFLGQNYLTYSPVKNSRHSSNNSNNNSNNSIVIINNNNGILKNNLSMSSSNYHHHNHNFIFDEKQFSQYLNKKFRNKLCIENEQKKNVNKKYHSNIINMIYPSYESRLVMSSMQNILTQSIKYLKDKLKSNISIDEDIQFQDQKNRLSFNSFHRHILKVIVPNYLFKKKDDGDNSNNFMGSRRNSGNGGGSGKNENNGGNESKKTKAISRKAFPLMTIIATRTISVVPWEKLISSSSSSTTTSLSSSLSSLDRNNKISKRRRIVMTKCILSEFPLNSEINEVTIFFICIDIIYLVICVSLPYLSVL